jgi:hypothetical protein
MLATQTETLSIPTNNTASTATDSMRHNQHTNTNSNSNGSPSTSWDVNSSSWDSKLMPASVPFPPAMPQLQFGGGLLGGGGGISGEDTPMSDCSDKPMLGRSVEESCKRALDHFPNPTVAFPMPTLEFDFRIAVTLKPEPSHVDGRAHKEITGIEKGTWSGSFGHGRVLVCGKS